MPRQSINPLLLILLGFQVLLILYMIDQRREVKTMQKRLDTMQKHVDLVEKVQFALWYTDQNGRPMYVQFMRGDQEVKWYARAHSWPAPSDWHVSDTPPMRPVLR